MDLLADVAVPVPLAHAFTYRVPPAMGASLAPGARVLCEFGRRKVAGIVLEVSERPPPFESSKLKDLLALIDPEPALPAELLRFLRELAAYYFAPIGEVMRLALPAVERERLRALERSGQLELGQAPAGLRTVGGRRIAVARPTDAVEKPGSLRGQTNAVLAALRLSGECSVVELEKRFSNARRAVRRLCELGLVELDEREVERAPLLGAEPARDVPPELTAAQLEAVQAIEGALAKLSEPAVDGSAPEAEAPGGTLLFGVTGSGKTEVYLRAIATCLARDRGALVLVPEIALTPQLLGRFRARFGNAVALLHSGLAPADRHQMWQQLRSGELQVAIGARSALFAPVQRLGLVVVDEEHDSSFKQEEGVRYHARDMALLRAYRAGAVAVLGSATPSLEAMALVERGKLREARLPERAYEKAVLPEVETIDLKRMGPGPTGDRRLSLPLHRALEQVLGAGEQAIVFLNRRGFSPSVICESCGHVQTCELCSVALTYHRRSGGRLRCHYCDYSAPLGERCQECSAGPLSLEGLGTEKLENTLAEAFPSARVERLDRDVAPGARSEAVLDRMRRGEIDVLVGTQMVTKGHDLPRVTLVGVVNADAALSMPDFRAAERGFQLLVQVAGRAGRRDRQGRVLVQTRDPDHPAIRYAVRHDVAGFLAHERNDRREVGYPPYRRLALVRIDDRSEQAARRMAGSLAALARKAPEVGARSVDVLGPAAAPIARLRGRYRFRVLLRASQRAKLRAVLRVLDARIRQLSDRRTRVVIDVDPVSML
ncbi:MAG: primosomal protein N' [Deltaproteobacteria bacterium]|jgi:primosomal protein N' (replication factor Y)|nr:primosomal protein N' [Deltaproteobacteria bacterium]MBW2537147.1 primosomal protein N' [Deltaproteobacteria bacterium]